MELSLVWSHNHLVSICLARRCVPRTKLEQTIQICSLNKRKNGCPQSRVSLGIVDSMSSKLPGDTDNHETVPAADTFISSSQLLPNVQGPGYRSLMAFRHKASREKRNFKQGVHVPVPASLPA